MNKEKFTFSNEYNDIDNIVSSEPDYDSETMIEAVFTNTEMHKMTIQEVEKIKKQEEIQNAFDSAFEIAKNADPEKVVKSSQIAFVSEASIKEQEEKRKEQGKNREIIVNGLNFMVECVQEAVDRLERTSDKKDSVRKYNKVAEMPKITYAKAAGEKSFIGTLIKFLIACTVAGSVFGVQANSYMAVHIKDNPRPTAMNAAFGWLMESNLPINLDTIYGDAFGTGFLMGFGILGIIGLFIYLDNDAKKQSRVGHEHGSARLGTDRDYKIFKNKFMEG